MRTPSRSHFFALWASALLASCSMIFDLSPDQCGSTADCKSFGEGFYCEAGTCKTDAPTGGRGGTSGTSGNSGTSGGGTTGGGGANGGTGATNGGGGAGGNTGGRGGTDSEGGGGGMPPEAECETNADCEAKDPDLYPVQPTACIEATPGEPLTATCVPLKSTECPILMPSIDEEQWLENLRGENPIILGAYAPLNDTTLVSNYSRAYDLALTEFSRQEVGLPGPGGSLRPVVLVVCDHESEQPLLESSLDHLVGELKVPALIT